MSQKPFNKRIKNVSRGRQFMTTEERQETAKAYLNKITKGECDTIMREEPFNYRNWNRLDREED